MSELENRLGTQLAARVDAKVQGLQVQLQGQQNALANLQTEIAAKLDSQDHRITTEVGQINFAVAAMGNKVDASSAAQAEASKRIELQISQMMALMTSAPLPTPGEGSKAASRPAPY